MADSIYDELDEPEELEAPPLGDLPAPDVFVCDYTDEDGICGASFDNQRSLNMHALGKHRDKSKDSPRGEGPKAKRKPASRARASNKESSPRKAAAKAAPAPVGNRAETYASSIAMAALGAYLVVPPFDTYDLDVVNRGALNLADALASAGDQNQTIRQTCDLILGGGAGGAYIQLILALSAIVVPICAHHGVVPASAGERFGAMIGAQPSPAAPSAQSSPARDATADATGAGPPDFANMSGPEVLEFFSQFDTTVLFDLASKVMTGEGPDIVDIGGVPGPENLNLSMEQTAEEPHGDRERGSEQLAPDAVPVPS